MNVEAARRQALENQSISSQSSSSIPQSVAASTLSYYTVNGQPLPSSEYGATLHNTRRKPSSIKEQRGVSYDAAVATPTAAVQQKMDWAAAQLISDNSIENSIQLCQLIKTCGETLLTLQQVKSPTSNTTG